MAVSEPGPGPAIEPAVAPGPVVPRVAVCGPTDVPRGDPDRAARALAFSLWGLDPDDVLLAGAQSGELSEPVGLDSHVRRMLEDPRAQERLVAFGHWWLGLDDGGERPLLKDPEAFPEFDESLALAMYRETDLFMGSLLSDPSATLGTLLGADYSFANGPLGALYGVDVVGDDFERIQLDPAQRSGLFTQPLFLSSTTFRDSNPARRGFSLRQRLLCGPVPPPPCIQFEVTPERADDETTRDYYERQIDNPACVACHAYGTFMGFGFEHYDALGRFREDENGLPIDSTAEVIGLSSGSVEYADAPEMLRALATEDEAQRCFAQHWLTFLLGRDAGEVTRQLGGYVLEASSCPLALEQQVPVPCTEEVSVATLAGNAAQCAIDGEQQLNLRELTVALATTDVLMNGSFECGGKRCLSGFEWCNEQVIEGDAGVEPSRRCEPYTNGDSGCDVALAQATNCSCALDGNAATVTCRQ